MVCFYHSLAALHRDRWKLTWWKSHAHHSNCTFTLRKSLCCYFRVAPFWTLPNRILATKCDIIASCFAHSFSAFRNGCVLCVDGAISNLYLSFDLATLISVANRQSLRRVLFSTSLNLNVGVRVCLRERAGSINCSLQVEHIPRPSPYKKHHIYAINAY